VNAVAFLVNVTLNLALIPPYGLVGAAVAAAGSTVVLNAVTYLVLRRHYGITPFTPRSLRAFVGAPLVVLSLGVTAGWLLPASMLAAAAVLPLLGVATVATTALVGGLEAEDVVVVEFVEETVGVRVPLIRRYVPGAG